jgi:recombination protein RecT
MGELTTTPQNNQVAKTGVKGLSEFLNSDSIKNKFTEILGQKGVGFISSVLSVVNSNKLLKDADRNSIYTAALMAASLDLPINQNLGFAYIVPYNESYKDANNQWQKRQLAQFQLGYKGFIQLAQRSGQYKTINSTDVREGELTNHDRMTGEISFNWIQDTNERLSKKIIGYISYFELNNGFKSTLYMTMEEIEAHAKRYSQSYKSGNGIWKDDFPSMAKKTVTKLNLSKNGPLSIEMQRAVLSDQAVIKSDSFVNEPETLDIEPEYVDNNETKEEKVADKKEAVKEAKKAAAEKVQPEAKKETPVENVKVHEAEVVTGKEIDFYDAINKCKTTDELLKLKEAMPKDDLDLEIAYSDKKRELASASEDGSLFKGSQLP